jgi:hypothetical protein
MSRKNPSDYWQYIDTKLEKLTDPRLPITKHIEWTLPQGVSTYSGAEPDNYNLAIYADRPIDFVFIADQCFYRVDKTVNRRTYRGWISLYVAQERLQTILFNREILKIQPQAVWRYPHAKLIREKRTLVNREVTYTNRVSDNFTTEERLWQQGYYEKLRTKYFDDEAFFKVVGTPRGSVLSYQPEVDNEFDGL